MDHIRDPRELVRVGYDLASHAYRGDTFDLEGSGYAYWLGRFTPLLADGARVLDLGCGNGVPVARELVKRFAVTGVDLSGVQIARACRLVPGAHFVRADMTTVQFPPGAFDAVVAFYSIINVPLADQPALIARVAGWLAPGGRFLAVVGKHPWTGVEKDWRGVPGVRMYYSQADVATYRRWFAEAGFAVEAEGSEPKDGNPGYAVLIARRGA
jgi:SAM-dependent methyltransferase